MTIRILVIRICFEFRNSNLLIMINRDKLFIHMPFFRLIDNLEQYCALNVNCEIYISAEALDSLEQTHIDKINLALDKHNLKRSVHAPFMDLNPGSLDRNIREAARGRFTQCIDVCIKLKADRMVTHAFFNAHFYKKHKKEWLENAARLWKDVYEYADSKKVLIAMENTFESSAWAVLELLKKVKGIKACFDIAHYNVCAPEGWEGEFSKYQPDSILEVHCSDNDGTDDKHMPLGEGNIDFKKFFSLLKEKNISPFVVLEPHDRAGLIKNLEYMKSNFLF